MAVLTARQVAGIVASQHPPAGTTVAEWVQVAKDESSYRTDAVSVTGCCRGLWQINVKAHRDKIPETNVSIANGHSAMSSPLRNFYVAKLIYAESKSWRPWSAVRGARPVVSAEARAAAANPDYSTATSGGAVRQDGKVGPEQGVEAVDVTDIITDPIEGLVAGIKALVEVVNRVGAWMSEPHNWTRVAYVAAGGALVIGAGAAIASDTKVGQTVVGAGTKAVTKGKV